MQSQTEAADHVETPQQQWQLDCTTQHYTTKHRATTGSTVPLRPEANGRLSERLMPTKWQHLTPDECAANKSIYAKHLLIIIIRYAAHTHTHTHQYKHAYLESTHWQAHTHTHTHTQSTFNPNLHLCAHGNCLVYGGQTAITCRALCVFSSA